MARNAVLDALDKQIADLEERLDKMQPLMDELRKLRQARRVLTAETNGSMGSDLNDRIAEYLRASGAARPTEIAHALGGDISGETVRGHLTRRRGTLYERLGDGRWEIIA